MTRMRRRFLPVPLVAALWTGTGRALAGDARHASWRHLSHDARINEGPRR